MNYYQSIEVDHLIILVCRSERFGVTWPVKARQGFLC